MLGIPLFLAESVGVLWSGKYVSGTHERWASEVQLNSFDKAPVRPLSPLLKMAVIAGVETAVRLHIRRGDDLDARDDKGLTPLMMAAAKNKAGICRLLLGAGVNSRLADTSGRDALTIARAAGAWESAGIIEAFIAATEDGLCAKVSLLGGEPSFEPTRAQHLFETVDVPEIVQESLFGESKSSKDESQVTLRVTGCVGEAIDVCSVTPSLQGLILDFSEDDGGVPDSLEWEVEEDGPAPDGDETLAEAAGVLQRVISGHQPVDLAEDWGDFEVFLPERAVPLPRAGDEEGRSGLRGLFLRAVREGSVPELLVETLARGADGSKNEEAEILLSLVLNDLGAETDERIEIDAPFLLSEETSSEEDAVSDALDFMDDVASGRNDPLRHYARETQRTALLTAEDEAFLGREMEDGTARALDALAAWPDGVARVSAAADLVRSGEKDVEWVFDACSTDPAVVGEGTELAIEFVEENEAIDESDAVAFPSAVNEFLSAVDGLGVLSKYAGQGGEGEQKLREALSALALSRSFLSGLAADKELTEAGGAAASRFVESVRRHEQARERMILSNLKLVLYVAKRYQGMRLLFDDLIQEGNIGLMKAVERYDWRRGFKFSTYAIWWIRQGITRALADSGRTIRIPVHLHETMWRVSKEADGIERQTGVRPSVMDLADSLSLSPTKVTGLLRIMEDPLPIHEPGADGIPPADSVEDPLSLDPFISAALDSLGKTLEQMLSELDERSAVILRLRYGLEDGTSHTLEETGERFGVTRERIRQIESKALVKLAHPLRAERLLPWLEMDFSGLPERARCTAASPRRFADGARGEECEKVAETECGMVKGDKE